ncbi:HmuY family protein [Abyssalbus ytuae]|uniref:HmuY protein n=1 Tax=Abyssalbus ytuae TaxID=2926907 RepID=A0A9E6ZR98_9FLAO|nr:HmuY family protein [Abyssalbus ytuae]UOB16438.1 hypothetical protein MQE35_11900 [Abyssalbus ytuae]
MKNNFLFIKLFLLLLFVVSCSSDDDNNGTREFVVAFENPSVSFSATDETKEIKLVFSRVAPESGTAVINYTTVDATYDTDFTTVPSGETGTVTVNITQGTSESVFTFNKLQNPIEGTTKSVTFSLESVTVTNAVISGNTELVVSFTDAPALWGIIAPEIGGPNEPNQVYIDLSSQTETAVRRDAWDLGFYSGEQFRVILNTSLAMAAGELEFTDIDAVTEADVEDLQPLVATGTFTPDNLEYVDAQNGDITQTAIAEISETDDENKVYLLNLGGELGVSPPDNPEGGTRIFEGERGWKKIRILKDGDNYILQYADLNDTTHEEVKISKNNNYNFTFYSLDENSVVDIEPMKDQWDLNFTVFTNSIEGFGSYVFADFVANNTKAGARAYLVSTEDISYNDFAFADVVTENFSDDHRAIGSFWRDTPSVTLFDDVFFVLQDPNGNIYKIRFTALVNESGERGYSKFEYSLLQ